MSEHTGCCCCPHCGWFVREEGVLSECKSLQCTWSWDGFKEGKSYREYLKQTYGEEDKE